MLLEILGKVGVWLEIETDLLVEPRGIEPLTS